MSNLNSQFNVLAGLPPHDRSALQKDIVFKSGLAYTLAEGTIVTVEDASGEEVIDKMTSTAVSGGQPPDVAWLVIEGNDQSDGAMAGKCTCIRLKTGVVFQAETAESFTIGDLCQAIAGVIKPLTGANEQAIGQIIGVNSAAGTVVVAS
jgi:hypothetical protein